MNTNEQKASFSRGAVARVHTLRIGRVPENVDKNRIKDNVVLIDELKGRTIIEYTNDTMQPYIDAYNKKQKQKCRRITEPYTEWHKNNGQLMQHVKDKESVEFAYEYVWCYGNHEDLWEEYFNPLTSEERKEEMRNEAIDYYKKCLEEFQKNYPHLKVLYCVIHMDEPSGSLHCHTCFQPQAEYDKGLARKVCIGRALSQDGIERLDERKSADVEGFQLERLIKDFRHRVMNRELERLGYEIGEEEHGKKHMDTNEYKIAMKELDEVEKVVEQKIETALKMEIFKQDMKEIDDIERLPVYDPSKVKTIPAKKGLFGQEQEEMKQTTTENFNAMNAAGNIKAIANDMREKEKKMNKKIEEVIETIRTGEDIELKRENERLKELNEKQRREINSLNKDITQIAQARDNAEYTITQIKNFIRSKSQRMYELLIEFLNPKNDGWNGDGNPILGSRE